MFPTAERDSSQRCATLRADERGYTAERSAPRTSKPFAWARTNGWQTTATRQRTRPRDASDANRATGTRSEMAGATTPAAGPCAVAGASGRLAGRTPATGTPSPTPRSS
eukprot:5222766-Pleurochrysis_carterae.AAC.1